MPYPLLSRTMAVTIKKLQHKKYREATKTFVVEGYKSLSALLKSPYQIKLCVTTPSFVMKHHSWLDRLGVPCWTTTDDRFSRISNLATPPGVLAVVHMPKEKPIQLQPGLRALVMADIQDPGNLGTILRIADWYGISKIICSPHTVDHYNPKVIQASMGSFAHTQCYYTPLVDYLKDAPIPVIGAMLNGPLLGRSPLPSEGLLVIGNEANGIPPKVIACLSHKVTIPRYGLASSLNAAVAAGIIMHIWAQKIY